MAGAVVAATFFLCLAPHPTPIVRAAVPAPVELGTRLFQEKGCQHCHGADGRGGDLGPDLSTIGKRWKNPQIEAQIRNGGGGMPAFGDALQPDEISALVEFLHTKRKAPKQKKDEHPAQPAATS